MPAFPCPHCGQRLKMSDDLCGRKGKCPQCARPVMVPAAIGTTLADPAPPSHREAVALPPDDRRPAPGAETQSNADPVSGQSLSDAAGADCPRPPLTEFLAPAQGPGELGRLGPYRVLRVLGAGGMGVVYRAEDPQLRRLVALKAMLPKLAASPSARQRFLREARSAAAIEHDHVVHIYQVGEDRGVPFLAMQLLQGESLDDRLKRGAALTLAEVLRVGRETAAGLAAAHKGGLIHRDIKPANLWLEAETGRVKILDFGLARGSDDATQLTQLGAILGTPSYMAPEQACGEAVDGRCDLFSLGCVLYRLSAGVLPFPGQDAISILLAVASEHPKPPCVVNPKVPIALSELVMRLLAKKPDERPPSAQAVVEAIRAIETEATQVLAPTPRPAKPAPARNRPKPAAAADRRRPRGRLLIGLAGLAVVLIGLGAYLVRQRAGGTQADPAPVVHLFNGKDLTNFYTYLSGSALNPGLYGRDNDPENVFTVHDDMLRVSGKVPGCLTTRDEYANYRLIVEYKWGEATWAPRVARARTSGVLLHCVGADGAFHTNWPESFRCTIQEGGTGTLFSQAGAGVPRFSAEAEERGGVTRYSHGAPLAALERGRLDWDGRDPQWVDVKGFRGATDVEKPAGEWNRLECVCAEDRLTVILNGQVVNEAQNLSNTRGKIALLSDRAAIFFRTIDLQPLANFQKATPKEEKRWQPLFNTKDLTGWVVTGGKLDNWGVKGGVLSTNGNDLGWLMTEKVYADFEVRLEYRMSIRTNSGVGLRTPPGQDPYKEGLEIQIYDDASDHDPRPENASGSICSIIPSSKPVVRPPGEWNHMLITALGRRVTVDLNGRRVLDANLDKYKDQAAKHPGLLRDKGRLGLQSHTSKCEFREIYVRPRP